MRERRRAGEDAVGQVFSFMVAGAVFLAAVAAILLAGRDAVPDPEAAEAPARQSAAESLADLLAGSPGIGWEAGPDGIARLGLQALNGSGLQAESLAALRGALYAADAENGRVDYEEALASLGIVDGTRFHVRIYPIGLEAVYGTALDGLRVGYVGDWASLASVTVALATPEGMEAEARAKLDLALGPQAAGERAALAALGLEFGDRVHIAAAPTVLVDLPLLPDPPLLSHLGLPSLEGDVYPDIKSYLDATLAPRLPGYDILVVGSGVQHSSLTSSPVKGAIRDWVLAGGTLVVLGSDSQSYQWLQPLFHTGVATVNGAAFAPDVSHPILHEPHELDWLSYDDHGRGWDIKDQGTGAHHDDFSHVVVKGGEDVLAISNEGAFGAGRILLSTWRPGEIAQALGQGEAERFLANVFLYADRSELYLEYGPTAPSGLGVAAAVRQSHLWDDKLGQVPVRIEVHVWVGAP